jgi:hypothetical protein
MQHAEAANNSSRVYAPPHDRAQKVRKRVTAAGHSRIPIMRNEPRTRALSEPSTRSPQLCTVPAPSLLRQAPNHPALVHGERCRPHPSQLRLLSAAARPRPLPASSACGAPCPSLLPPQ